MRKTNWLLSLAGSVCLAMTIWLSIFPRTAFAACMADIECPFGMPVTCLCWGNGDCTASAKCVTCNCAGLEPAHHCCKLPEEE